MRSWTLLGPLAPVAVAPARETAHWAVQIAAGAGASRAEPEADASHTSLEWLASLGAFAGAPLGPNRCRAALRLADLGLLILDAGATVVAELPLAGRTMEEGIAWLGGALARARGTPVAALARPEHDLPDHPVAHGGPFDTGAEGDALEALAQRHAKSDRLPRAFGRWRTG